MVEVKKNKHLLTIDASVYIFFFLLKLEEQQQDGECWVHLKSKSSSGGRKRKQKRAALRQQFYLRAAALGCTRAAERISEGSVDTTGGRRELPVRTQSAPLAHLWPREAQSTSHRATEASLRPVLSSPFGIWGPGPGPGRRRRAWP